MTHTLLLVRHAEPTDRDRCHGAQSDPGLSRLGRRQAEATALRVRVMASEVGRVGRLLQSPAHRAAETAAPIAATLGLQPIVDDDWRERDWGDWEGERWDDLWPTVPDEVTADAANYLAWTPPGGEPTAAVRSRVVAALEDVPRTDDVTVVVTHAGVIRLVLAEVLDLPLVTTQQFAVPYARMAVVTLHDDDAATLTRLGA